MRKSALLFATALFISAPLIAATPTLTYAAAKKASGKGGAATVPGGNRGGERAAGGGPRPAADPYETNSRFARAINDLMLSLSRPTPMRSDAGAGGGGRRTAAGGGRPKRG